MTDMIDWLRSPKPWHKYTPAEVADEIERLNAEVTHYAQAYHREMVANKKLQAVVDAAERNGYATDELIKALAALKGADHG